jgi:hypothetical protein
MPAREYLSPRKLMENPEVKTTREVTMKNY